VDNLRIAPTPAAPKAQPEPSLRFPGSFIDAENWLDAGNVKELAYGLRINAELADLAYRGLRAHEVEMGRPCKGGANARRAPR